MANRWLENIRATGQLSVFPGASLTGTWPGVFSSALQEFNTLSNKHGLGITLTRSSVPVNRFLTGANVQFEASNSSFTFNDTFWGPQTVVLGGSGSAAKTRPLPSTSAGGRIGQSLILMPATPEVFAGPTLREAGDPIKLVMAVHELVHACGLDNVDHASLGDPDLFTSPITDSPDPNDPSKDLEDIGTKNGVTIKIPPLFLSARTAIKIQALWLLPNPVIHFPHTF